MPLLACSEMNIPRLTDHQELLCMHAREGTIKTKVSYILKKMEIQVFSQSAVGWERQAVTTGIRYLR